MIYRNSKFIIKGKTGKARLNETILEQVSRMLDFIYWFSGILITVSTIFIGSQFFINEKRVTALREENEKYTKEFIKKIFLANLKSLNKVPALDKEGFVDYSRIYKQYFNGEYEIEQQMKLLLQEMMRREIKDIFKDVYNECW